MININIDKLCSSAPALVDLLILVQSKCVRPFFASTESQESESDMNIARQCALRYIQAMLYIRSLLSEPELVIAESNLVFYFVYLNGCTVLTAMSPSLIISSARLDLGLIVAWYSLY